MRNKSNKLQSLSVEDLASVRGGNRFSGFERVGANPTPYPYPSPIGANPTPYPYPDPLGANPTPHP